MIHINLGAVAGIDNQEDLEQYLQDAFGYSAEFANALMASFITHSPDAGKALNAANVNSAISDWIGTEIANSGIEKNKESTLFLDEKRVRIMADKAGYKDDIEGFIDALQKDLESQDYKITIKYEVVNPTEAGDNLIDTILSDDKIDEQDVQLLINLGLDENTALATLDKKLTELANNADEQFKNVSFAFSDPEVNEQLNKIKQDTYEGEKQAVSLGMVDALQGELVRAQRVKDTLESQKAAAEATALGLVAGANAAIPAILLVATIVEVFTLLEPTDAFVFISPINPPAFSTLAAEFIFKPLTAQFLTVVLEIEPAKPPKYLIVGVANLSL
jgi:hypothetical protein